VAIRHAATARQMFPGYSIRAVTNGVHVPTWTHPAFGRLFQGVAPDWGHDPDELAVADQLPDDAVWAAHAEAQRDLLAEVQRLARVAMRPDLPLIAFARRMAESRRTTMLVLPPCCSLIEDRLTGRAPGTLENPLFSTNSLDDVVF
jgi:glycogen phosphorylase